MPLTPVQVDAAASLCLRKEWESLLRGTRYLIAAIAAPVTILACRFGSFPVRAPAESTPQQLEALPPTETAPAGPTRTPFPLACGEDTTCFVQAVASCSPATVIWVVEINMLGSVTTSRTYLEIRGQEDDRCLLYVRTEGGSVTFSPELIAQLRASGLTDEQIAEQQQQANASVEATRGLEGTCRMAPADLVAMLGQWQAGSYSTEDWEGQDCQGSMFPE